MKKHDDFSDFPAAHSMDSGWFAVDKHGMLAHFDTGEAGAFPEEATYATGEAGDELGAELWEQHVAPWIARNMGDQPLPRFAELLALFDTAENAAAAVEALGEDLHTVLENNPLLVEVVWRDEDDYWSAIKSCGGFIGFAPSLYSLWEDGVGELLPIARYDHGDWAIPGAYVRQGDRAPVKVDGLPSDITRMETDFSTVRELNLADFFEAEACVSWAQTDLRTGEPIPRESFMSRLKKFFQG